MMMTMPRYTARGKLLGYLSSWRPQIPPRALIGGGVASIVVADMAFRSSGDGLAGRRSDAGRRRWNCVDLDGHLARTARPRGSRRVGHRMAPPRCDVQHSAAHYAGW